MDCYIQNQHNRQNNDSLQKAAKSWTLLYTHLIFKISYLSHNSTRFFNCSDYQAAVLMQHIEYICHNKMAHLYAENTWHLMLQKAFNDLNVSLQIDIN